MKRGLLLATIIVVMCGFVVSVGQATVSYTVTDLDTTDIIESPNSGARTRTRRVKNWQDHEMVVRWVAADQECQTAKQ
ncbi:MAG: hypothetical protein ABIG61_09580 [Planctomycetota bacterium]